jgi:GntR family transcriptional regulator, transcriptional repressor for pyruvate dehydrogenase complex
MPRTSPVAAKTARAPSQSQRVVVGVTERIRRGDLRPGERVPTEPALMREFGVSRSVVREAVSRLQASGLVHTRQGVGSFVLAATAKSTPLPEPNAALKVRQKLAMLELRLSLESDAAALAAQRRTAAQLAAMEAALAHFEGCLRAGSSTAEADFQFHELIAQATGNEYFAQVLRSLSGATIPRAQVPQAQPVRPARRTASANTSSKAARFGEPSPELQAGKSLPLQEHLAVLDGIRRGDATLARAAMFMHLNNSRERMKAASG